MSPDAPHGALPRGVTLHVLNTGWASAPEWILIRGGRMVSVRVPALVGLIHHPREGWGLFDTGYSLRVRAETSRGVFWLYRALAPMSVSADGPVVDQLGRFGLTPDDIGWIVLSHFHADHLGGLFDFPRARFIASEVAWNDVRSRRGLRALRYGFVPALVPPEFEERLTLIGDFPGRELAPFGETHDLFGDGTVVLCNVPGHARGQICAHVETGDGPVLLAADGCWLGRSYRENRAPHWITGAFVDSTTEARRTVSVLHDFAAAHPETPIVPSHSPEAHERFVRRRGP